MNKNGGKFWEMKSSQAMYNNGGTEVFFGNGRVITISEELKFRGKSILFAIIQNSFLNHLNSEKRYYLPYM
jgi:hypothetical protein